MSNWERRPLRLSQQHYGSLDAYSLILVHDKLEAIAKVKKLPSYLASRHGLYEGKSAVGLV